MKCKFRKKIALDCDDESDFFCYLLVELYQRKHRKPSL
jgi:hypothetical protein